MPQIMTEEKALKTVCPYMSFRDPDCQRMDCMASACACWGWVDPEGGQPDPSVPRFDYQLSDITVSLGRYEDGMACWSKSAAIGPRRGRCEAGGVHSVPIGQARTRLKIGPGEVGSE